MTEVEEHGVDKRFVAITWGMIVAVAVVVATFWSYPSWTASDPVEKCDKIIQARLKAPSTYERLSASGAADGAFLVTYEAQNSFGVPLRKMGVCDPGGSPEWVEFSS